MSELPVLPLWVNKYEGGTAHLSLEEDGAYMRLLRLAWKTPGCRIPDDKAWIRRMMRVDAETMTRTVIPILQEFFVLQHSYWISPRLVSEFKRANDKRNERAAAGSKGGKAKALKSLSEEASKATILLDPLLDVCHQQNASKTVAYPSLLPSLLSDPEEEEKEQPKGCSKKKVSSNRGTRLPEDWTLPTEWASEAYQYRTPNGDYLTEEEIRHEADKFRDHWHSQPGTKGTKLNWQSTWRNWIRNGAPAIIRARHAARSGGSGGGGQYEKPSLAAAFLRRAREREIRNPVSNGSDDWFDDVEGRGGGGEVVPLRKLTDW